MKTEMVWRIDRFNTSANGWYAYDYQNGRSNARARLANLKKLYPALRFRIVADL